MSIQTIKTFATKFDQKLYTIISSKGFFYAILLFFGVSAAWVATASLYPMAFDENVHIGIIAIYSHELLPILTPTQEMAQYGGVVADPSYFFHYLMSFPYRIERDVLQMSETASIIGLRFINIGFFIAGLAVFWHALSLIGLSRFARNIIIALCCLIPISPLIAGQVNYDNLLIVEVALCFLLSLRILASFKQKHRIPVIDTSLLLFVLFISSATKFAFLPIAAAIIATLVGVFILSKQRRAALRRFIKESKALKTSTKVLIISLLCFGALLNARYPSNVIQYQNVSPKCDKSFSVEACMDFGPYGRNHRYTQKLDPKFEPKNIIAYAVEDWIPGMTYRLFFTVAGPTNDYDTKQPVFIPQLIYIVGIIAGVVLFLWRSSKKTWQNSTTWLMLSIVGVYCLTLIVQLYISYRNNGVAVALNGRYLIPFAPIIGGLIAYSVRGFRNKKGIAGLGIFTTIILVALVFEGGGIGTYIVRGQPEWFWPGWGQTSHQIMQSILDPITLKSS